MENIRIRIPFPTSLILQTIIAFKNAYLRQFPFLLLLNPVPKGRSDLEVKARMVGFSLDLLTFKQVNHIAPVKNLNRH